MIPAKSLKRAVAALLLAGGFAAVATQPARAETLAELAQATHYHGIAFNRAGSAELLLATHHGIFAVTADGTATRVSPVHDYMGFSPDPSDPLGYFGSGHPAEGGNSGVLQSRDGGATWRQVAEGVEGPVDFHQMDVSPADPKVIYGRYGALQVSRDGGESWEISGELPPKAIGIAASAQVAERLYAATEGGLLVSGDSGGAWEVAGFEGEVVSVVETGADGALFAFVLGTGMVKGNEGDLANWQELANEFGDSIPLHMAVDPSDPDRLALTSQDNGVYLSEDGGVSWTRLGTGS